MSPNNDTLYIIAQCDVRSSPLVLDVPDTSGRYFVLQFVDAWTNNFAYVGTRATGSRAGRFLLAGTDDAGPVPSGVGVISSPTGLFTIVGRVQVRGAEDLPAVRELQDQFSLAPLNDDAVLGGVPEPDPRVGNDLAWSEQFRVSLHAFPPPPADAEFVRECARFGLLDDTSPYVDPDPDMANLLRAGSSAGDALIEQLSKGGDLVNGWRAATHIFDYNLDHLGPGTIDDPAWKISDRSTAYATRAVAARAGLWGNHGYEAVYLMTFVDSEERELRGDHAYELRLPSAPPVGAFWSLTMYDVPDYFLIANPIDRYSMGNTTPGLEVGDDGSITITMQPDEPHPDRRANWLPAPVGAFRPLLRMYMPGSAILDGEYQVPAITRID